MLTKPAGQHDSDFYAWTREQSDILRGMSAAGSGLDVVNLAEEIEDMGRGEILQISSLLRQTVIHLLKMAINPDSHAAHHWFDESITFQGDAVLAYSPGLKQRLDLEKIWRVASNGATRSLEKHGVSVPTLPATCPYSLDDLLDPGFDPEKATAILADAIREQS